MWSMLRGRPHEIIWGTWCGWQTGGYVQYCRVQAINAYVEIGVAGERTQGTLIRYEAPRIPYCHFDLLHPQLAIRATSQD